MFGSSQLFGSGGSGVFYDHQIDGSLFLDGENNAYAYRSAIEVDNDEKGTWSWWWKRADTSYTGTEGHYFLHNINNSTNLGTRFGVGRVSTDGTIYLVVNTGCTLTTQAVFKDQSAWIHILWVWDTSATSDLQEDDRVKLYLNGERVTDFRETTYPAQGASHRFTTGYGQWEFGDLGYTGGGSRRRFRGYMTEFHFMDGQAYGPEYFGEFKNGIWIPKEVTGVNYGTGGFYMPFTSNTNDASGNGNNFTANLIDADDFRADSPTDNHCILNPNAVGITGAITMSDGNMRYSGHRSGIRGSFAVSSGKWYWEVKDIATGTNAHISVSVADADFSMDTAFNDKSIVYRGNDGNKIIDTVVSSYGDPFSNSNTVGVALDVDNGTVEFFVDNTGQGTILLNSISGVTRWQPQVGSGNTTNLSFLTVNFGQLDFEYSPPSGFLPLKASNLPNPDIDPAQEEEPRDYFETFLYKGNGTGLQVGDVIKKPADTTTISNSLLFLDDNSSYLSGGVSQTSSSTYTLSMWFKRATITSSAYQYLFYTHSNGGLAIGSTLGQVDELYVYNQGNGDVQYLGSGRKIKDTSRWYHVVMKVSSNSATVYLDGLQLGTATAGTVTTDAIIGSYNAANYFDGYLAEIHFVDGTAHEPTDFGNFDANGIWIPKAVTAVSNYGTNGFHLDFSSATPATQSLSFTENWSDKNSWVESGSGSTAVSNGTVSFAPTSSSSWGGRTLTHTLSADYQDFDITFNDWTITNVSSDLIKYQIWLRDSNNSLVAGFYFNDAYVNTNTGTESVLYVYNGSNIIENLLAPLGTAARTYTLQSADFRIARTGRVITFDMQGFTNRIVLSANMNPVDRIVLTVERLSGYTYSPNSLGSITATGSPVITTIEDQAGSNDWTLNSMSFADSQTVDSPTNNHPTLYSKLAPLSEGNLRITGRSSNWDTATSTIVPKSGKWYCEMNVITSTATSTSNSAQLALGIADVSTDFNYNTYVGNLDSHGYFNNGAVYYDNVKTSTQSIYESSAADLIGMALDLDNHTVAWYKNGTLVIQENISDAATWAIGVSATTTSGVAEINLGQRSFAHTPPTGFVGLFENNVTVDEENLESPNFVWIKNRSAADSHQLYDTVRGIQKVLETDPDSVGQEITEVNGLIDFNKNGFTIGSQNEVNTDGEDYVAWCWKAGGTAVSNTNGSTASTVSANTESGFSIVKYTGTGSATTIGHGLSTAPELIIVKELNGTSGWFVYTSITGAGQYLRLHSTDTETASTNLWNNTVPTGGSNGTGVFSIGVSSGSNENLKDYIAYCFHSVEGYCKIGSYIGNESATAGPFIHTGFKPSFVMFKNIDVAGNWVIHDISRTPTNYFTTASGLFADLDIAEQTDTTFRGNFYSNGFTVASGSNSFNNNNNDYFYLAFAETPFKYATAR